MISFHGGADFAEPVSCHFATLHADTPLFIYGMPPPPAAATFIEMLFIIFCFLIFASLI